jgi:competence protein ComEC
MLSWLPYSLVRITLFFTAGILLGIYHPEVLPLSLAIFLFVAGTIIFLCIAYVKFRGYAKAFSTGFIAFIILVLAGYVHIQNSTQSQWTNHFLKADRPIQFYTVVINEQAREKENSWRVEGRVTAVKDDAGAWQPKTGKVLLYFSKKDFLTCFEYGDRLLIKGNPQHLAEPANPGEFNYKRFLSFNNINHQHFVRKTDVEWLRHQPESNLYGLSLSIRKWASHALLENIDGEYERAVISALVLGIKDGLDNELTNAYASSGAMHVLAVSGLHVGIIYGLLLFLLKPLHRTKHGAWAIAGISLAVLWLYAFVTGLSPSVLRAVSMFSFLALAKPVGHHTNIYNTLAASAFCLLLWNPFLIMAVGFQLSYLAVLGIVYLQPRLAQLWNPHSLWLNRIWEISCVSVAAQISTFLLGLLYYHQFPVYFLVSNLFVIPGAIAVLVLGLAVLVVSWIQPLAYMVAFILKWIVWGLNFLVFQTEKLPYSLIENVYISTSQCWFLMIALLSFIILIEFREIKFLMITACSVILFTALQWHRYYENINQRQLVIYKIAGHSAFDLIQRGKAFAFTDSVLLTAFDKQRFHIRPNRLRSGVNTINSNPDAFAKSVAGGKLIRWNNLNIYHVYNKDFLLPSNVIIDYLIVSRNSLVNLRNISFSNVNNLIFDSSNSFYFADSMMKELRKKGVKVHSGLHDGAFIIKF